MKPTDSRLRIPRLGKGLIAAVAAFCLLLTVTATALAASVGVSDAAGVLNVSQVKNSVPSIRYSVNVYTTNTFSGDKGAFVQQAQSHLNSNLIVVAISTNKGWITVDAGKSVPLSSPEAVRAQDAFISNYKSNHDYTQATISCLQSIQSSVGTTSTGSSSGSSNFGFGLVCLIGFVVLAAIALFAIFRRRSRGGPGVGPGYSQPVNYSQPYNQYPQGQYPPNYGPGYPPQQGQGMNPWAAGGLGAAAGGLLGYELGRHAGEREAREEMGYGNGGDYNNNPNEYGGSGGVGDFGGDSGGGDFGGGDSGGGGDVGSF